MRKILALIAMTFLLMGTGYGPGPVGPPGPGPDAPAPAAGPVGAGEGGVGCDDRDRMPKGQSCGRRQPSSNLFELLKK